MQRVWMRLFPAILSVTFGYHLHVRIVGSQQNIGLAWNLVGANFAQINQLEKDRGRDRWTVVGQYENDYIVPDKARRRSGVVNRADERKGNIARDHTRNAHRVKPVRVLVLGIENLDREA